MSMFQYGSQHIFYQWRSFPDHPPLPERPTLVFLHDGLGSAQAWKALPQRLAEVLKANYLVYDRYGYGRSSERNAFPDRFMEAEVEPLGDLLDHLGISHPHLIGHSDGGSIALLYAGRYPQRVGTLVTISAHTFVEPRTQAGIQALMDLQSAGKTPSWLVRLHGQRSEALLRAWGERWLSESHARWNIQTELNRVRCPLLVIQGDADEFGTLAQVESILARVPAAQSWIVPGQGHTPYHAEEEAFVAWVTAFLRPWLEPPGEENPLATRF